MTAQAFTISFEVDSNQFPDGGGDFVGTLVGFRDRDDAITRARNLIGVHAGALRMDSSFDTAGAVPGIPDDSAVIRAWVHTYVDGSLRANSLEVTH